jgi:hypothetical protein
MTEQTQQTEVQEPILVTLTLNLVQIQTVLNALGEMKTSSGVWPLQQVILQQAQSQLPVAEQTEEVSTVQ